MSDPSDQLSLADQRQIVYSSLLKYSPEAASLRERAMDRVILGALLGSSEASPFQLKSIQDNLRFSKNGPQIRDTTVLESLERQIDEGKVLKVERKKRRLYFLTDSGRNIVTKTVADTAPLFDAAFSEILENTECYFTREVGKALCRKIILECFSQMGRDLARSVADSTGSDVHFNQDRITFIVGETLRSSQISQEAKNNLNHRIYAFLRSHTPAAEKLKFHLTQGYYFTELLGFEASHSNPLAENSFKDAVFYLDANVLMLAVLEMEVASEPFGEAVRLSQKLGITLIVTRATLNELRSAAIGHVADIKKVLGILPERILERTDDQFLIAFQRISESRPGFTPDQFLEVFLSLDALLISKWGIEIDERSDTDCSSHPDARKIGEAINKEMMAARGFEKSEAILRHDVFHYLAVTNSRKVRPKSWFLTRDRALTRAAIKLADGGISTCFSLIGFLHTISPFLTTTAEQQPFSELFSEILDLQIIPHGAVFHVSELALIAEMHSDVLSTPPEQLMMALDYVKSAELKGQQYNISDYGKVSLGLKKFLTATKDEQLRSYSSERQRMEDEMVAAERKREQTEDALAKQQADAQLLQIEVDQATLQNENLKAELDAVRKTSVSKADVLVLVACFFVIAVTGSAMIARSLDWVPAQASLPGIILWICDLGVALIFLWAAFKSATLLIDDSRSRKIAYAIGTFLAIAWFFSISDRDPSRARSIVDLVCKTLGAFAFLGWTLKK